MNVVLGVHTSLISVCKLADADYISVLNKYEANIYDAKTTTIKVSEKAILKGCRCKKTGLCGEYHSKPMSKTKTQIQ